MSVFNIGGKNLLFSDYVLDYRYDAASDANFTVLRVYKRRVDGKYQYPFVYAPNGAGAGTQSTYSMNLSKGFPIAINAGIFNNNSGTADFLKPRGTLIQNGVVVKQETVSSAAAYLLTIDSNGDLGYAARDASGATLVSQGIVSAVCGWAPCIIDYESAIDVLPDAYDDQSNAQRQIIGQFGNGDYAIVTCEGRDYDHSDGWTMDEARAVCKTLGLKYAFNLDGGGSTETVLGKKQINTIYEGTYGRIVPTYIVFNGTTTFGDPG